MASWQDACLGDVLAVLKNGLNCKQDKSGFGQRVSRIESIASESFDLARVGFAEISEADRRKYRLIKGDILFSHINSPIHVGKTAVFDTDDEVYHGVNLLLMRPNSSLSSDYLELYLKYLFVRGYWLSVCKQSVNQASVNQQDILRVPIAYPVDQNEQRRIVEILDEAFEAIGVAKGNVERNLRSAIELLETNIGMRFAPHGETVRLSECATDISDGDHAPPPKSPTGIPFITISNIDKESRRIDFSDTFSVPREYFDALKPHRRPKRGDVLYTVTGSFGIPVLIENDDEFCFQRHIGLIRPKPEFDSKWLMYALLSPQVRAQAEAGATGTAQRTVSLSVLRGMTIPRIDIERQQQIAEEVDALFEEIGCLRGVMHAKYAALDELKKSLLHHAFTGQLTAKKTDQLVGAVA